MVLNAIGISSEYHAAVVYSSPSRISTLGCPEDNDPVNHLPEEWSRIKIIAGGRDQVVKPTDSEELLQTAQSRGAEVLRDPELAHPFQDVSAALQRRRFQAVAEFLRR